MSQRPKSTTPTTTRGFGPKRMSRRTCKLLLSAHSVHAAVVLILFTSALGQKQKFATQHPVLDPTAEQLPLGAQSGHWLVSPNVRYWHKADLHILVQNTSYSEKNVDQRKSAKNKPLKPLHKTE